MMAEMSVIRDGITSNSAELTERLGAIYRVDREIFAIHLEIFKEFYIDIS